MTFATVLEIAVWVFLLLSLGPLGAPLGRRFLPEAQDGGSGLGRILFLVLWGYLYWLVPSLSPIAATPLLAIVSLIAVGCISLVLVNKNPPPASQRKPVLIESSIFVGFFLLCLFFQSFVSYLADMDKFYDFSFFHSAMLTRSFPPEDRWFAGYPVNYYYLGFVLFVPLTKISSLPSEIAFNLGLASLLPLSASVLFSSARRVSGFALSLWFSVGLLLMGTLASVWLWVSSSGPFSIWNTSRVIAGTINEYPIFSFVLGIFHPHFISFPITLATSIVVLSWVKNMDKGHVMPAVFAGGLVGFHMGLQTWSVPPLIALSGMGLFLHFLSHKPTAITRMNRFISVVIFLTALFLSALPYRWHNVPPPLRLGWVDPSERSALFGFLLHWGGLLAPIFFLGLANRSRRISKRHLLGLGVCAGIAIFWGTTSAFLALLLFWYWNSSDDRFERALVLTGFAILIGCEIIHIREDFVPYILGPRINTVFKFHYVAWGFFLLAMPTIWKRLPLWSRWCTATLWGLSFLFLPLALSQVRYTSKPTLNGLAWLDEYQPDDAAAVAWLRVSTAPTDRIVEAVTKNQQGTSLLASFSGRPTLLGWTNHVGAARSHHAPLIAERQSDILEIYSTGDSERLKQIIRKYEIKFIALGEREKLVYASSSFEAIRKLRPAFSHGSLTIFQTSE